MLVYLQKMDYNSQQPSHMPLGGPVLVCPLMPLAEQHFHIHFNVLQTKHKQSNFHKQKEAYTSPNSSTKTTNNQITS
jgi:hypothetical protein